jgi:hypothetical protein
MPQLPENTEHFQQEDLRTPAPNSMPPETESRKLASEMMDTLEKSISAKEISENKAFDVFMLMDSIDELKSSKNPVAVKLYRLCEENEDLAAIYGEAFNIFQHDLLKKNSASPGMFAKIRGLIY